MSKAKQAVRSLLNIAAPKKISLAQITRITMLDKDEAREILSSLRDAGKINTLDYGKDIGRLYWFNEEILKGQPNRNVKPIRGIDINH